MTNKWTKPNELPDDFWEECFIAAKANEIIHVYHNEISTVKVANGKVLWYSNYEKEWFEFRKDVEYIVMPVEYPTANKDDFK